MALLLSSNLNRRRICVKPPPAANLLIKVFASFRLNLYQPVASALVGGRTVLLGTALKSGRVRSAKPNVPVLTSAANPCSLAIGLPPPLTLWRLILRIALVMTALFGSGLVL